MVTIDDVRDLALSLPRTVEALVREQVRFRVGRIVYVGFSRDETLMGFAFRREEREALIASEPDKFMMPKPSDQRYNWVVVRLSAHFEAWLEVHHSLHQFAKIDIFLLRRRKFCQARVGLHESAERIRSGGDRFQSTLRVVFPIARHRLASQQIF